MSLRQQRHASGSRATTSARSGREPSTPGPLWHTGARKRLRVLLPELVVSIVAMTCMSSMMILTDEIDVATAVAIAGITQLVVQTFLYVCTYQSNDWRIIAWGWVLVSLCVPLCSSLSSLPIVPAAASSHLGFAGPIAAMTGMMLFYLTRSRVSFALLAIEVLVVGNSAHNRDDLFLVQLVLLASLAILFVMRSSATRITIHYEPVDANVNGGEAVLRDGAGVFSSLGMNGQVVLLGAAAVALSLAMALAGAYPMLRGFGADGTTTAPSSETKREEPLEENRPHDEPGGGGAETPGEADTDAPADEAGDTTGAKEDGGAAVTEKGDGAAAAGEDDGGAATEKGDDATAADKGDGAAAADEDGDATATDEGDAETTEKPDDAAVAGEDDNAAAAGEGDDAAATNSDDAPREDSGSHASGGMAVGLVLIVLLVLPLLVWLLLRKRTRRLIVRQAKASDCVAMLYLGIISRLEAAGIVRDEAQTPREFLDDRGPELEELTLPVGMGLDQWATLTSAYEKARYAGLEPTKAELDACWRLYDTLPICIRRELGLRRYVTSSFWKM